MIGLIGLAVLAIAWAVLAPVLSSIAVASLNRRVRELEARLVSSEVATERLAGQIAELRKGRGPAPGAAESTTPETRDTAGPVVGVLPEAAPEEPPKPATPAPRPRWTSATSSVPPVAPPPAGSAAAPPTPPAPPVSLEERLGTRWAVWIGGIALALGGLLLARYSIEQGYFGPGVRIVMGLIFAAALIAAGEWFRRNERDMGIAIIPAAHIPGVLTAAGTATAFGTIYAAHALYEFIGPATTFLLLGAVGIATMLAAALHGPALAGLGLAGSYIAPMLVSSAKPNPWPLVAYLAVVAASAMGLARLRHWLWLATFAIGGAFIWGLPFVERISGRDLDWTLAGYLHALLQLALAAGFLAIMPNLPVPEDRAAPDRIATRTLGALSLLAILMLAEGRFDPGSAVPFTLAVAGLLLAAAWLSPPACGAAVLAGIVALAGVGNWPGLAAPPPASLLSPVVSGVLRLPENVSSFLAFATLASLAVTAVAGVRLMRGRTFPVTTSALYALAATATPLLALLLAYLRVKQFDTSIHFGLAGLALAALFAFTAESFQRAERGEFPGTRLATGAFAAAAIAALCFSFVTTLERGYLTVALALAALGTAYVAALRDIPLLRHVVTVLALTVLGRIAWDPRIMGGDVGRWPILNWLLIGYGIPAAAFALAGRTLATKGQTVASRTADATAILLAGLLCFFQVHHALNDGNVLAQTTGHVELGLLAVIALGFSYALMRFDLGRANPIFHGASMVFGVLSGLLILLGLGLAHNPLLSAERVTGPLIFSSLLLAYLLPALAATALARAARPHRPQWYVTGIAVLALLLVFAYVTLEVRHVFHGERLSWYRATTAPEQWAYSAAWLALGILLLAYGIVRASLEARIASATLVMLSVAKVFVFDLAGLTGLWRALSLIVLGLVLIGIGLVYQRFLFARPAAPRAQDEAPG